MTDTASDTIDSFLDRIVLPATALIHFSSPRPSLRLGSLLACQSRTIKAILASLDTVCLGGSPRPIVTRCYAAGRECLRVESRKEYYQDFVTVFRGKGASITTLRLNLSGSPEGYDSNCWKTLLAAFPHITHLEATDTGAIAFARALRGTDGTAGSPRMPLCRFLTDLRLSFPFKDEIGEPLRNGDTTAICARFLDLSSMIEATLRHRTSACARLTRLDFIMYESGSLHGTKPGGREVVDADLASTHRDVLDTSLESLRMLVDGEVLFRGYRYFVTSK